MQKIGAPDAREASGLTSTGVTTRDVRPYALKCTEDVGADMREIQKAAVHASLTTTEGYLEQHRDRLVDVRLQLPQKPSCLGRVPKRSLGSAAEQRLTL